MFYMRMDTHFSYSCVWRVIWTHIWLCGYIFIYEKDPVIDFFKLENSNRAKTGIIVHLLMQEKWLYLFNCKWWYFMQVPPVLRILLRTFYLVTLWQADPTLLQTWPPLEANVG